MDHDVDMVYGMLNHTWNNKANYLHKVENKEVDEEDLEEREQRRLNKLSNFVTFASYEKDEQQAQAIFYTMIIVKEFEHLLYWEIYIIVTLWFVII